MTRFEREEGWRNGFEAALELAIVELDDAKSKDAATKKLMKYLGSVKQDKIERLKEMLSNVPGRIVMTITEEKADEKKEN